MSHAVVSQTHVVLFRQVTMTFFLFYVYNRSITQFLPFVVYALADLHIKIWTHDPPPPESKFFQFHAIFSKFWQNCVFTPLEGSRPHLGEILDPPLLWMIKWKRNQKLLSPSRSTIIKLAFYMLFLYYATVILHSLFCLVYFCNRIKAFHFYAVLRIIGW